MWSLTCGGVSWQPSDTRACAISKGSGCARLAVFASHRVRAGGCLNRNVSSCRFGIQLPSLVYTTMASLATQGNQVCSHRQDQPMCLPRPTLGARQGGGGGGRACILEGFQAIMDMCGAQLVLPLPELLCAVDCSVEVDHCMGTVQQSQQDWTCAAIHGDCSETVQVGPQLPAALADHGASCRLCLCQSHAYYETSKARCWLLVQPHKDPI